MLCRGGRNLLLRVMFLQGLIKEPTDAAFEVARIESVRNFSDDKK
jgi:hypothetical protein